MIVYLHQIYKQIIDYIHYYRNNMKIKIELEIDTEKEQDLNTIEECIAMLRELADNYQEE